MESGRPSGLPAAYWPSSGRVNQRASSSSSPSTVMPSVTAVARKPDHQTGRERPGLGHRVAHLADPHPGILGDLAADRVLKALADLDEARQRGVPAGARSAMAGQQDAPGSPGIRSVFHAAAMTPQVSRPPQPLTSSRWGNRHRVPRNCPPIAPEARRLSVLHTKTAPDLEPPRRPPVPGARPPGPQGAQCLPLAGPAAATVVW
jgi:hypothetical protein